MSNYCLLKKNSAPLSGFKDLWSHFQFISCFEGKAQIVRAQNYWAFGLFRRLVFLEVETRHFGNWFCFRPQVKGGGRGHLLCLAPWKEIISITGPDTVSEMSSFYYQKHRTMEKVQKIQ
jgi:hypothetical protein